MSFFLLRASDDDASVHLFESARPSLAALFVNGFESQGVALTPDECDDLASALVRLAVELRAEAADLAEPLRVR